MQNLLLISYLHNKNHKTKHRRVLKMPATLKQKQIHFGPKKEKRRDSKKRTKKFFK